MQLPQSPYDLLEIKRRLLFLLGPGSVKEIRANGPGRLRPTARLRYLLSEIRSRFIIQQRESVQAEFPRTPVHIRGPRNLQMGAGLIVDLGDVHIRYNSKASRCNRSTSGRHFSCVPLLRFIRFRDSVTHNASQPGRSCCRASLLAAQRHRHSKAT